MALHPSFPISPYECWLPEHRWFPADEALRSTAYEKLLPPLVAKIRREVHAWRASGYVDASATSRTLLRQWFDSDHLLENADGSLLPFRYYFAQREAVETVIWLHEVRRARDKFDLLRFDASGAVSTGMFEEDWPRYVLKMATGAGKTKVLSLLIAWSFFHKLYEPDSALSRNFLVIAPNIIVLDRLRADFDGLRIFFNDPILPPNGHDGRNWRDDFQLTLHIQDDVRVVRETGNLFLTNIHRVFLGDVPEPSLEDDDLRDYFLADAFGAKPAGKTTESQTDLGEIIREVDELAIFNDEAHHIHDRRMAWFGSIQDIHHRMLQRDGRLALQVDVTATPRHDNGAIFVQTVSDYPLVEAIHQNVVKHPVLPDAASRAKLREAARNAVTLLETGRNSAQRREHEQHEPRLSRGATTDRSPALQRRAGFPISPRRVATVEPLIPNLSTVAPRRARFLFGNPALKRRATFTRSLRDCGFPRRNRSAIVSVLMLKEGWDVRNVTVICGLRAYAAKSNILPEQTLGRGLRRMYFGNDGVRETVSVMGTAAFMEFVESIQSEGVTFDRVPMGGGATREESLMVEVDTAKNLDALDIPLPRLSRRYQREFKDLAALDPAALGNQTLALKAFTPEETREIVFKTMLDAAIPHTITLDGSGPADYRSVVAFFARQLLHDLRLVGGYDVLYGKVKIFLREHLFTPSPVDLEDPVVLRNLSEPDAGKILYDAFKAGMNALTIQESGSTRIEAYIKLRETRPFRTEHRPYLVASKSLFTKIVGEPHSGGFELTFAAFLEAAPDVTAFAKNYLAVGFKLDYVRTDGDLSNYLPDFLVKTTDGTIWIVETKGRAELDLPRKMARLAQWCADATAAEEDGARYDFVFVDQKSFEQHAPQTFAALAASFTEYRQPQ